MRSSTPHPNTDFSKYQIAPRLIIPWPKYAIASFFETILTFGRFWVKEPRHSEKTLAEICHLYRKAHRQFENVTREHPAIRLRMIRFGVQAVALGWERVHAACRGWIYCQTMAQFCVAPSIVFLFLIFLEEHAPLGCRLLRITLLGCIRRKYGSVYETGLGTKQDTSSRATKRTPSQKTRLMFTGRREHRKSL